jgi:quinol monooxygenase YgiN
VQGRTCDAIALFHVFPPSLACAFQVRAEQGCVNYDLYTPGPMNDDEEAVLFIETW